MNYSLLVVEDDLNLQQYLKDFLLENGFLVKTASTGADALQDIQRSPPDIIVLDLGLPDISGETVCQEVKRQFPDLPVVILTAKDTPSDVVHGLAIGADDYITKPFTGEELLARVHARLRHQRSSKLQVADLILETSTMEVKRGNRSITLTPHEFKLLEYLMLNHGKVLTREMILNRIWSYSPDIETRVVDVYMGYLRKKIDQEGIRQLIHTVRGFGYMIKE